MKRLFIILLLLNATLCLMANPMDLELVSEYWFNSDGDLFMELCPSEPYYTFEVPLSDLMFTYDEQSSFIVNNTDSLSYGNPVVINFSELSPPLILPHYQNGLIRLSLRNAQETYSIIEEVNVQYLILPRESSYVHWLMSPFGGSWYWVWETPPTPGLYPFTPQSTGTLRVYCYDYYGNPVPQVHIRISPYGYLVTDSSGVAQSTFYCRSYSLDAYYPVSGIDLVYSNDFYITKDHVTNINIPIRLTDIEDQTNTPSAATGLKIYPVPFNPLQNTELCFQLPEKVKKSGQTKLKIYNTKGQFVTELKPSKDGLLRWNPQKDVSSGIYTVRLIKNNRIVETQHFSLIK